MPTNLMVYRDGMLRVLFFLLATKTNHTNIILRNRMSGLVCQPGEMDYALGSLTVLSVAT